MHQQFYDDLENDLEQDEETAKQKALIKKFQQPEPTPTEAWTTTFCFLPMEFPFLKLKLMTTNPSINPTNIWGKTLDMAVNKLSWVTKDM